MVKNVGSLILLGLCALVPLASAHRQDNSPAAVARRHLHTVKARNALSSCASKLKAREVVDRRLAKRDAFVSEYKNKLRRRQARGDKPKGNGPAHPPVHGGNQTVEVPCILTPEVTVGPYYVKDRLIRHDIREGQAGIDLLLDLQFVDTNTCEVVPKAMVDVWHCNTTGSYSGFANEGTAGEYFNRGLQPTDKDGIMHILTNFPGWYQGRATHIHIAAHINGTMDKKTKTYKGGTTSHIGQVFFPESILDLVDEAEVYKTNDVTRLRNDEDFIFAQENTGYDAVSEVHLLGDSIEDGMLAFISVGVDFRANHTSDLLNGGAPPGGFPTGGFPTGFPTGFPSGTAPPSSGTPVPTSA